MAGTSAAFVVGIVIFCVAFVIIVVGVMIAVYCCYFRKRRLRKEEKLTKSHLHDLPQYNPLAVHVGQDHVYGQANQGYISPVTIETPSPRANGVFTLPGDHRVLNADYVDPAGHRPRRHSFDLGNDRRMYTVKEGTLVRKERGARERPRDTRSLVGSTHTLLSTGSRVRSGTLVRPVYATTMTTLDRPGSKNKRVMKSNSVLVGFEPISNKKIALLEDQRVSALSMAGSPRSLSPPGSPISARRHYSTKSESHSYFGPPGIDDPDGNVVRWSPSMKRKMDARMKVEGLESVSAVNSRRETPLAERKAYDLREKKYLYTMNGGLQEL